MKKIVLILLLVPQFALATDNNVRQNRLVNSIANDVQTLTTTQIDSITVATTAYFSALQSANAQYRDEVKLRITVKAEAEAIYYKSLQQIMTILQWQQWNTAKEARKQQLVEQHKN